MKRLFALLLIIAMAASLCGCSAVGKLFGGAEATPVPEETPTPEPELTPTPAPVVQATPIPLLEPNEYQLTEVKNEHLRVSFEYPSHWINEPGLNTIVYVEPVEEGDTPMRVAVTVKQMTETKMTNELAQKEFKAFVLSLQAQFDKFKRGDVVNTVSFMNRSSLSCTYNAYLGETLIRGFVVMTYVTKRNQLYAFHFYAPSGEYEGMKTVARNMMYSVKPL